MICDWDHVWRSKVKTTTSVLTQQNWCCSSAYPILIGTNALANGVNSGDGAIKLDANGVASANSPVRSRTGSTDALGGFEKSDGDEFDDGDIAVERTRCVK